jgi:hypothetical protein
MRTTTSAKFQKFPPGGADGSTPVSPGQSRITQLHVSRLLTRTLPRLRREVAADWTHSRRSTPRSWPLARPNYAKRRNLPSGDRHGGGANEYG